MPGAIALGIEIFRIVRIGRQLVRHAFHDVDAVGGKLGDLFGVVGEQPDPRLPDQRKHPCRHAEIACVDRETQAEIRVDGIMALILQAVRPQLVDQADAPTFLAQIEQDSPM